MKLPAVKCACGALPTAPKATGVHGGAAHEVTLNACSVTERLSKVIRPRYSLPDPLPVRRMATHVNRNPPVGAAASVLIRKVTCTSRAGTCGRARQRDGAA